MEFAGHKWPSTGRKPKEGAKLEVHQLHAPWLDLCWYNEERDLWFYLSTIPNPNYIKPKST
jgi:hypothetical protein